MGNVSLPSVLSGIFKDANKTYMMVVTLSILSNMDHKTGRALLGRVELDFHNFYKVMEERNNRIDQPPKNIPSWSDASLFAIRGVMARPIERLGKILEKGIEGGRKWIGFKPEVWALMSDDVISQLRQYADQEIRKILSWNEEVDDVEPMGDLDFDVKGFMLHIQNFIQTAGFTYPTHLIENFYLSLKSKPFTILAGISGTGKTKLVKLFAEALGATRDNGQFVLIPVRPDWNDPADLIGYTDLSGKFRPGELTKVLREAADPLNFCKPYFICLDEMNLARVEHYFSDLLSIMETQEWELDENGERTGRILTNDVVRYAETNATGDPCEVRLHLPENVFLIGTVNMDETTHPFSKKVLDRANTIEFQHIELTNLAGLDTTDGSRPEAVHVHQSFLRGEYLCLQDAWGEHSELIRQTSEQLEQVNAILQSIHAHVGYRVRDAVCFYLIYNQRFDLLPSDVAFDLQLTQKILPRIQGSSRSVQGVLVELMRFAAKDGHKAKMKAEELDNDASLLYALVHKSKDDDSFEQHMRYPISARKIAFMLRRFDEDGFTSYWLS